MLRLVAFLLVLLLCAGRAIGRDGSDAPLSPQMVAEAVAVAFDRNDATQLQAFARRLDPDPWLVADALMARGQRAAARAFAASSSHADLLALPAYLKAHEEGDATRARRQLLAALRTENDDTRKAKRLAAHERVLDDLSGIQIEIERGRVLRARGEHDRSAALLERVAGAAQKLGWHAGAATAWYEAGLTARAAADAPLVRRLWNEWREEERTRGNRSGEALALGNLGVVAQEQGEYAEARDLQERSLALLVAQGDRDGQARAHINIGGLAILMGAYGHAEQALDAARALYKALGDVRGEATAAANLGLLEENRGHFARALEAHRESLALLSEPGYPAAQAAARVNVGAVLQRLGDTPAALLELKRADESYRQLDDRAGRARTLGALGNAYLDLGEIPRALSSHEASLRLMQQTKDGLGEANALGSLGAVHERRGDYAQALRLFQSSYERMKALRHPAGEATSLLNLGVVYDNLGREEEARATYERALKILESIGDDAGAATAVTNMGRLHLRQGELDVALDVMTRAVSLSDKVGDPRTQSRARINLADLHMRLEKWAEARTQLDEALAFCRRSDDRVGQVLALGALAAVERRSGMPSKARKHLEESLELAHQANARALVVKRLWDLASLALEEGNARIAAKRAREAAEELPLLVRGQDEERGASGRAQWAGLFETGMKASLAQNDLEQASWFIEAGRAGSLLESLGGRDSLRTRLVPRSLRDEEADARANEARAARVYRGVVAAQGRRSKRRSARRALNAARQRLREVIERIQREAKTSVDVLYPQPKSLREIQAALVPGDVLVLYALADPDSVALVVRHDGATAHKLPALEAIHTACETMLLPDDPFVDPAAAAQVRKLVVEPLRLGTQDTRVLIAPDGPLALVPFSMLLPDRLQAFVPSGTTYVLLREQRGLRGTDVLGFGDPDYTDYVRRLQPLPGTRDEVMKVADVARLGPDATEAALQETLAMRRRWRALHLACHGIVNRDSPMRSALALSAGPGSDGLLTVADLLRMETPADFVALSACDTGRGKVVRGEGLLGFVRAFMFAGAPRVLVSQWEVDDAATSAFMQKLYERWNPRDGSPGVPLAQAVREAQAFVRSNPKWAHPSFWAPWVLWGLPDAESSSRLVVSASSQAERVRTAGSDKELLARVLRAQDPDPWTVAEILLLGGHRKAAAQLAAAGATPESVGLAAYIRDARAGGPTKALRAALTRARRLHRSGDEQEALRQLPATLPRTRSVTATEATRLRARLLAATGKVSAALLDFAGASSLADELGWLAMAARCQNERGLLAFRARRFDVAIEAWRRLIAIEKRRGKATDVPLVMGNLGVAYQHLGAPREALTFQRDALAAHEAADDVRGVARAHANIAAILMATQRYADALSHAEAALEWGEKSGDRRLLARVLGNLGLLHAEMGHLDKSLAFYQRALRALEHARDGRGRALTLGHLGSLHERRNDLGAALVSHRLALHLARRLGDGALEATALGDVGAVHFMLQQYAQAESAQRDAIAIWTELGDAAGKARAWSSLGLVLVAKGDFPAAVQAHRTAIDSAPKLAADPRYGLRFGAARAAVQAGPTWHGQALQWLRADLSAWAKQLPESASLVANELAHWKGDAVLAPLRDGAELPASWRKLWNDVDALWKRATDSPR